MRQAEMEIKKGQNMVEHEAEIFARPARTWFQSEKEKSAAKGTSVKYSKTRTDTIRGEQGHIYPGIPER